MMSGNVISLFCVFGAVLVMTSGNDGWGWLLFVAVLFGSTGGQ